MKFQNCEIRNRQNGKSRNREIERSEIRKTVSLDRPAIERLFGAGSPGTGPARTVALSSGPVGGSRASALLSLHMPLSPVGIYHSLLVPPPDSRTFLHSSPELSGKTPPTYWVFLDWFGGVAVGRPQAARIGMESGGKPDARDPPYRVIATHAERLPRLTLKAGHMAGYVENIPVVSFTVGRRFCRAFPYLKNAFCCWVFLYGSH